MRAEAGYLTTLHCPVVERRAENQVHLFESAAGRDLCLQPTCDQFKAKLLFALSSKIKISFFWGGDVFIDSSQWSLGGEAHGFG